MGLIIRNGIKYVGDNSVELTQAQYDALSQEEKLNGTTYYITDGQNITTASAVTYDNTASRMTATNVQSAIDEVNADKMDKVNPTGSGSFSLNRKADTTIGTNSFAEGSNTTASGNFSHAEGALTIASGTDAHAEGRETTASGLYSHAEGMETTASAIQCHAEGANTTASAQASHAEGVRTIASGSYSHAEGSYTTASAQASHSEGSSTTASGQSSHAEGTGTTANHKSQHVFGEYNALDDSSAEATARGNYVEIVGNGTGTGSTVRSNARTLDWSGNEVLAGTIEATGLGAALKQVVIDAIYPIGSIYMSVSSTNPGTTFGVGTWEAWGSGRVPVGVDSNDTSFDTVEETGGNKSNSYTPAGTIGGTKLTADQSGVPAHSHGLNSHTHSVGAHKHGLNSHTHSVGAHKHGLNSHTHTIPALSGTAAKKTLTGGLSMSESVVVNTSTANVLDSGSGIVSVEAIGSRKQSWANATVTGYYSHKWLAEIDASHNHSVTTVANTTGEASGSTANSSAFDTGAASGSTANSSAFDTGAASGSTADNTAKAASKTHTHTWTGTAANISTVQPYITCYMWKRTA